MCEEENDKVPERPVQSPDDQIQTNKDNIPTGPSREETTERSEES